MTGDFTLDGSARIDGKIGGNVTVTGNPDPGSRKHSHRRCTGCICSDRRGSDRKYHCTGESGTDSFGQSAGDIATKVIVIDEHAVFQGKIDMNQTVPDRKGKARTAKAVRAGRKSAKAAIAEALKEVEEEEKRENQKTSQTAETVEKTETPAAETTAANTSEA